MTNDDIGSQQQLGYNILGELRRVATNLSQSERLKPIVAITQDFIVAYAAYLDALIVDHGHLVNEPLTLAKEIDGDPPDGVTNAQIAETLEARKRSLLALHLPHNFSCDTSPQACLIIDAWQRLVESQFASFGEPPVSDSVWQIIRDLFSQQQEIEDAFAALFDENNSDARPLRDAISNIFGFDITLNEDQSNWTEEQRRQKWLEWQDELINLLIANIHVAAFFQELLGSDAGLSGLEIVRQIFAQNPDGNTVEILLGGAASYQGLVPLPSSNTDGEELKRIRLGSDVSVATIVHELGHQFDRWFRLFDNSAFDFSGDLGLRGYFSNNQWCGLKRS